MLSNITIGQYYPCDSKVHRLDPRTKILITFGYIITIFLSKSILSLALGSAFVITSYIISGVPLKMILKSIRPIIPIITFTSVLNVFFMEGGKLLLNFWVVNIYEDGVRFAAFAIIRILCLIAGSSLLTYTTSPVSLTNGIEKLLSPLNKLRFPVHELTMMMTIALRYIPEVIEETNKIMLAQKSRGADMTQGSLVRKIHSVIPILIPLFVSSFRRANELALAMECRCYKGGEGRTSYKRFKFTFSDSIAILTIVAVTALVILLNFINI